MGCPEGTLKSATARHMNWVEEQGGLPRYIENIACDLHFGKEQMDISEAIATAVNVAKKMCTTGDLEWPGIQHVNPGSRQEACEAVAHWEAMKAAADAKSAAKGK